MTRTIAPKSIVMMREASRRQVLLATGGGAAMDRERAVLAQTRRPQEPIRIGFSMALTGGLAGAGKPALIAMEIWREDINAKGGLLGRPVEFVYYDDQTTPANVPKIYTKLLNVDNVDLVVSGYGTNSIAPAMPVIMRKKLVFMTLFGWPPTRSTTTTAISRSCPPAPSPRSTGRAASSS